MFSESDRISMDLETALQYPDKFSSSLIIRPWYNIDVDMEFRCFVSQGVMTAISQYNHGMYFKRLFNLKDNLRAQIVQFWTSECQQALSSKFKDYVIDIAVCKDQCYVIELNPWEAGTDAALFSWKEDHNLLYNKESHEQIEFRVLETVPANSLNQFAIEYRDIIRDVRRKVLAEMGSN